MSDAYSLFSTEDIPREEYMRFLLKMNATDVMAMTNHVYDASIMENTGSFHIRLDHAENIKKRILIEYEDDELQELYALLGGEPKTHMRFEVGSTHESQALAVKFAAMIADHYPCVVKGPFGNTYYTSDKLIDLRNKGLGFDGFDWKRIEENRRRYALEDAQEAQENAHKEETGEV